MTYGIKLIHASRCFSRIPTAVHIAGLLALSLFKFGSATDNIILYKSEAFVFNSQVIVFHEKSRTDVFVGFRIIDCFFEHILLHSSDTFLHTYSYTYSLSSGLSMTASTIDLLLLFLASALPSR